MTLLLKITNFLSERGIDYQLLAHAPVYTSKQAAAARADVSLHQGAKAMVVKIINSQLSIDNCFVMCVLPGDKKIDFKKLRKELGVRDVRLASPEEVEKVVGVKIGAVSPFGNLSGLRVLLDDSIMDNGEIVFNAGDHSKSVKMKLTDYLDLVRPEVAPFSYSFRV